MYETRKAILKKGFPPQCGQLSNYQQEYHRQCDISVYSYKKVDLIPVRDISCRFIQQCSEERLRKLQSSCAEFRYLLHYYRAKTSRAASRPRVPTFRRKWGQRISKSHFNLGIHWISHFFLNLYLQSLIDCKIKLALKLGGKYNFQIDLTTL